MTTSKNSTVAAEPNFDELKWAKYEARRDVDISKFKRNKRLADNYRDHLKEINTVNFQDLRLNNYVVGDPEEQGELRYWNPIEGTVRGMVSEIITTIIIELSIRKVAFHDITDSKVLLKSVPLLDDEEIQSHLSGTQVKELLGQMNNNVNFASLPLFRSIYTHYKSNDWLVYQDSDFTRFIKGETSGYTERYESDDLIIGITEVFGNVNPLDLLSKAEAMVKVAHLLIRSPSPPSTKVFRVLMDFLDERNMLTYQLIILKHLVPYKARASLLSDEFQNITGSLIVHYYQSLIEKEPKFINTLFNFYDKIGKKEALKHLLSFMKFDEILELERIYNLSIYSQLLSKSRYLRSRRITDLTLVNYHTSKPLKISKEDFYNIIEKCTKHEMFQYIDFMINKIIFQSLDDEVLLAFHDKELQFTIDNENITEIKIKIFDNRLLRTILDTVNKSNDLGRLMWLIPNLDTVLAYHQENNSLDRELVNEIISTLRTFGLDGKVISYEKLLK